MTQRALEDDVEVLFSQHIKETDKAHLVLVADTGEQTWFPKSQVGDIDLMDDGTGVLTVSRWIARQKGLVE